MRIRRLAAASFCVSVVPASICSLSSAWARGFLCVSQPSRSLQQFRHAICVHPSRAKRFWHLEHLLTAVATAVVLPLFLRLELAVVEEEEQEDGKTSGTGVDVSSSIFSAGILMLLPVGEEEHEDSKASGDSVGDFPSISFSASIVDSETKTESTTKQTSGAPKKANGVNAPKSQQPSEHSREGRLLALRVLVS